MYKVGDKVIIKKMETVSTDYPFLFCRVMSDLYASKVATIKHIQKHYVSDVAKRTCLFYNGDDCAYVLDVDKGTYTWHSSMFKPFINDPNFINFSLFI